MNSYNDFYKPKSKKKIVLRFHKIFFKTLSVVGDKRFANNLFPTKKKIVVQK